MSWDLIEPIFPYVAASITAAGGFISAMVLMSSRKKNLQASTVNQQASTSNQVTTAAVKFMGKLEAQVIRLEERIEDLEEIIERLIDEATHWKSVAEDARDDHVQHYGIKPSWWRNFRSKK